MKEYISGTRRISIFTGHFGSGKTEVAVNFAMKLSEQDKKVTIVDFDIVNPFFRTADARSALENRGVRVITPIYANTNVDVPALPPEIYSLFESQTYNVVLDVGGDDVGARALARYREEIIANDYQMYLVINTRRPMTDTPQKITEMIEAIQYTSRLKVTSLVNNTNLLNDTRSEDIEAGMKIIKKVSLDTGIPIGFVSGLNEPMADIGDRYDTGVLRLEKNIRLPWDK